MRFSIVIPTYNRKDKLEFVLPRIANQDFPKDDFEIILSDSGSSDGTKEFVENLAIPNLRFITGENAGRSGARNRGIREAKGEYILFTDADIIAEPDLLAQHDLVHREKGECAVVGCEVQVNSLDEFHQVSGKPEKFRTLHQPSRKRLSWLYFLTGNASVSRQKLLDAGMFDEQFQGYGHEDLELGYRLEKAGLPIFYGKDAINYHWHPVGFEENCGRRRLAGISTVRFYNKHRDQKIKLLLGWNPFNLAWHSIVKANEKILNWMKKGAVNSRFLSEAVLQYCWIDGIKEGVKTIP
jgi:glycosyltransferase involved in cell wall biosynthesis